MVRIPYKPAYSNELDENPWSWHKIQNNRMKFQSIVDSSDSDDYNGGEERFDDSNQYSIENTQNLDSYDDDESLMSVNKRSHWDGTKYGQLTDLCPMHKKHYKINDEWNSYALRTNYTERICNHTITSTNYNRQLNRVCDAIGVGFGTHCFQRFTSKIIEVVNRSGKSDEYTEGNFRDGCSCGWATKELGNIYSYHLGNKIFNVCQRLG